VLLRTSLFPVTYSLRFIVTFFVLRGTIFQMILAAHIGYVNRTDSKSSLFLGLPLREVDEEDDQKTDGGTVYRH
jgi:hypothetical protein